MGLQGEQKLGKWVCGLARQGEVGWRKSRENRGKSGGEGGEEK